MSNIIDLVGQRFGRLVVVHRVENKGKQVRYLCRCDCGNEKIFYATNLKRGLSTSCGCFRKEKSKERQFIDLTNKKFGYLTVLELDHYNEKTQQYYWKCQCDCGNQTEVMSIALRNGTSSCGCIISMGEDLISSILRDNKVDFKKQYSFDDLYTIKNKKLYFDFGILNNGKLQCLIEYQGRQHFIYDENWKQTKEDFEEGQND